MTTKNQSNHERVCRTYHRAVEELEDFRRDCFSQNSAEEFLEQRGESLIDYRTIFLSVAYADHPDNDRRLRLTELELADMAIDERCRYVTNIDYCVPCIAATGLIRREG